MKQGDAIGEGDYALPFSYTELLVSFAADSRVSAELLLEGSGLHLHDLVAAPSHVRSNSYSRMVLNLLSQARDDALLPWRYGRAMSFQTHGAFGLALRSARTLGEAYDQLPEQYGSRSGGAQFLETRSAAGYYDIVVHSGNPDTPDEAVRFHSISSLINLAWLARAITGTQEEILPGQLHLAWPCPEDGVPPDTVPPGLQLVFSQAETFLRYPTAHLRIRTLAGAADLKAAARSRIEHELSVPPATLSTVGQVKWALGKLGLSRGAVESVSALLHVSPATLKRRLKGENASFLDIKNSERFELVKRRLRSSDVTLSVIAEEAGYDNPSNLSKAFKQHFGLSPGAFRAGLRK
ncbi:AraC family transcriptional regulator [Phaeobacter inhibens]|uniref:AraC family transcriptional regulator n=1 Tax=Phaeobacter inhibens TaxID=221822 RepID=UPI0021A71A65|nr:AraC family transcriptional regulator [Phaeobacter inhibens]UWR71506.1 AraC family transcriptional regulator [Phaeobacter inhibens]